MSLEVIQQIDIHLGNKDILRLYIKKIGKAFAFEGERISNGSTTLIGAVSGSNRSFIDCNQLFESCLSKIIDNNEHILRIHNPCNAPYISINEQEIILNSMHITSTVTLN